MIEWQLVQFKTFLLVFLRVSGLFVAGPFFGATMIPARVKALVALGLAFVLYPLVAAHPVALPDSPGAYLLAVLGETAIGLLLG